MTTDLTFSQTHLNPKYIKKLSLTFIPILYNRKKTKKKTNQIGDSFTDKLFMNFSPRFRIKAARILPLNQIILIHHIDKS